MTYIFSCEACKTQEEKEIPISQYSELKDSQYCTTCGAAMQRVFTDIGGTVYNCKGMYDTDSRNTNFR